MLSEGQPTDGMAQLSFILSDIFKTYQERNERLKDDAMNLHFMLDPVPAEFYWLELAV